jgi:hypothetical protein
MIATLHHTQRHAHTLGSSSLEEELARRSGLLHNTQHSQETDIDASSRIRNSNPSKRAYYANRQPVNSSLISRNSKLQIYRTSVRPVVTYGSEPWTLTMEE